MIRPHNNPDASTHLERIVNHHHDLVVPVEDGLACAYDLVPLDIEVCEGVKVHSGGVVRLDVRLVGELDTAPSARARALAQKKQDLQPRAHSRFNHPTPLRIRHELGHVLERRHGPVLIRRIVLELDGTFETLVVLPVLPAWETVQVHHHVEAVPARPVQGALEVG